MNFRQSSDVVQAREENAAWLHAVIANGREDIVTAIRAAFEKNKMHPDEAEPFALIATNAVLEVVREHASRYQQLKTIAGLVMAMIRREARGI